MVILDVIEKWKEYKRQFIKESSYYSYCFLIKNYILPFFGEEIEFTESKLQEFVLEKIKFGLSVKTIKDCVVVIKMIQKYGAKQGYWNLVPFDLIYPTDQRKKELDIMSKDNQRKLMKYLKNNFSFYNLGLIICLSTGIRIGEICALKWCDFDRGNNTLRIQRTIQRLQVLDNDKTYTRLVISTPKTSNSQREIPLSNELVKMIKPLLRVVNCEYFVLSNALTPIEPRRYRKYYKKILNELEIPDLKFHGLRHSFATRCIESKSDYKTLSVLLGHSNITTTLNLYVHPNNEEKKKCIEKMLKNLM